MDSLSQALIRSFDKRKRTLLQTLIGQVALNTNILGQLDQIQDARAGTSKGLRY